MHQPLDSDSPTKTEHQKLAMPESFAITSPAKTEHRNLTMQNSLSSPSPGKPEKHFNHSSFEQDLISPRAFLHIDPPGLHPAPEHMKLAPPQTPNDPPPSEGAPKGDAVSQEAIYKASIPGEHELTETDKMRLRRREVAFFFTMQVLTILFYGLFTDFAADVDPGQTNQSTVQGYYPMFQDVHVMIFIGFGFLMAFLKYHSWTSVMFNFFVATWSVQWGILSVGLWHRVFEDQWSKIDLNIVYLIEGDFAAAAVLISFGAVLGKVNSFQLLMMATIEVIFYGLNAGLGQKTLHAIDMGGSMYVHTFGAYFGLACSWMLGPKKIAKENPNIGANYTSNMFAAIGTLFLFMFWPSFNAALATGNSQHRVVVNTVLALCASTMGAYCVSALMNKGLFKMEDCLNATLTGGVIIGSSSDLVAAAWVSILIGFVGGGVSSLCFNKLSGWLYEKWGLHDTCGVHNLHGLPGVLAGIIGAITCAAASKNIYGDALFDIFPELANGRTQGTQAGYQLLCLCCTLTIAIVSGILTGFIIRSPFFMPANAADCFDDEQSWVMEIAEEPIDKKLTSWENQKFKIA
jgi:ammonium transporter Rh